MASSSAQHGLLSLQLESSVASSLQLTFYISIVSLVIWFWDMLLNLDVEISVIWLRKGTIAKAFYAVVSHSSFSGLQLLTHHQQIRYIPLLVLLPNVWCQYPSSSLRRCMNNIS